MPSASATFLANLGKLVAKFEADKVHYLSKDYSESQAKVDFITPLFRGLGWDVENEAGLPHHERDVIVEKGETEGRPDYNFRLGGQTKFFVEAKAPSEPVDAARHILQARGYAWNTRQVFFVALTDFEEFRFYDASFKPDMGTALEQTRTSCCAAQHKKRAARARLRREGRGNRHCNLARRASATTFDMVECELSAAFFKAA